MIKLATLLATTMIGAVSAFNSGKAGWKLDADGKIEMRDGNPIYVKEDGSEATLDGSTVSRLNAEAKQHRERAEKAEGALAAFKDIDADKARQALEKVAKLDSKALIDAGEVDKLKDEIARQYTGQIAERDGVIAKLNGRVDQMTLESAFSKSRFIAENIAVPAEMFQAQFGKNFKVEEGKIVAYDATGNKIFSKARLGELADVDEAFAAMVETYPHKDAILRAPNAGGSGNGGNGGNRGTGRTIRRADFDALPPAQQAAHASAAGKGKITIVD